MRIPGMKCISTYLAVLMFLIGISPRVYAGLSPSEMISVAPLDRQADLDNIRKTLEMKAVKARLTALGFNEEEVYKKVSHLTDAQVHQLAQNLDEIRAGGSALGVIIALLVIAILVVLLLQLTGHRVIVT